MSRLLPALLLVLLAVAGLAPAHAETTLERVKARGTLRCGGVERPGLAREVAEGRWVGLEFELCRAIAAATLGSPDRVEFSGYESPDEFARVARRDDDVHFLTGPELIAHGLTDQVVLGPPVFLVEDRVMIPDAAPEQHLAELAGKGICFVSGTPVEEELNGWFESSHIVFAHHAHSETGERNDAYGVQHCHAVASEVTDLALIRLYRTSARVHGRLLPEALGSTPVFAVTATEDARWSAIVAWVVHTLVAAERPASHWTSGGAAALPVAGAGLGLRKDWQQTMLSAVGHYGEIFARTLGGSSPLKLERGANRITLEGGALAVPLAQ